MKFAGSDPSVQNLIAQVSQEAAISKRIRSTDSAGLFRRLGHNSGRNSLPSYSKEGAAGVQEVAGRKDYPFLWLNDYNVSKENLEGKLSEQDNI